MDFKTKRASRTFKNLFDMFTSNKLSTNVYYCNITEAERRLFYRKISNNPDKYLHNIVLSEKQSDLIKNILHIDTCDKHHCNKYYKKCYDCSYDEIHFGCACECKGCYDNTGNCSICMMRNNFNTLKLDCSHIFHKECISKWLVRKTTCPYCRRGVSQEFLTQNDIESVAVEPLIIEPVVSHNIHQLLPNISLQNEIINILRG